MNIARTRILVLTVVMLSAPAGPGKVSAADLGFILLELLDQIASIQSIEFSAVYESESTEEYQSGPRKVSVMKREVRYWWKAGKWRQDYTGADGRKFVVIYDGTRYLVFSPDSGQLLENPTSPFPAGGPEPTPLGIPFLFLAKDNRPLDWPDLAEHLSDVGIVSRAVWKGWHTQGESRYAVFELSDEQLTVRVYFSVSRSYYPERVETVSPADEESGAIRVEEFWEGQVRGRKVTLPLTVSVQHQGTEGHISSRGKDVCRILPETLKVNHTIPDSLFTIPPEQVREVVGKGPEVLPTPQGRRLALGYWFWLTLYLVISALVIALILWRVCKEFPYATMVVQKGWLLSHQLAKRWKLALLVLTAVLLCVVAGQLAFWLLAPEKPSPRGAENTADLLTVHLGKGIGPLEFGATEDKIVEIFGQPSKRFGKAGEDLYYEDKALFLMVHPRSRRLSGISCYTRNILVPIISGHFPGKTAEGIAMGASEDEIVAAYGKPVNRESVPGRRGGTVRLYYLGGRVTFVLLEGRLVELHMMGKSQSYR